MHSLPAEVLSLAFQAFADKAYPEGLHVAPGWKRERFARLLCPASLPDVLPPSPLARGFCEIACRGDGFAFRVGSVRFPHLKLVAASLDFGRRPLWVFGVDTHDRMLKDAVAMSAADAEAWFALQTDNSRLKREIETAWDALGIPTHLALLREELAVQHASA